jgi:hypothetical protein
MNSREAVGPYDMSDRKVVLKMVLSLDGFATSPDGTHDWMFEWFGDDSGEWNRRALEEASFHAMGRRSYEIMGPHWAASDAFSHSPCRLDSRIRRYRGAMGESEGTPAGLVPVQVAHEAPPAAPPPSGAAGTADPNPRWQRRQCPRPLSVRGPEHRLAPPRFGPSLAWHGDQRLRRGV